MQERAAVKGFQTNGTTWLTLHMERMAISHMKGGLDAGLLLKNLALHGYIQLPLAFILAIVVEGDIHQAIGSILICVSRRMSPSAPNERPNLGRPPTLI